MGERGREELYSHVVQDTYIYYCVTCDYNAIQSPDGGLRHTNLGTIMRTDHQYILLIRLHVVDGTSGRLHKR